MLITSFYDYLTWFMHHQPSRQTGARCWTIGAALGSCGPKVCPAFGRPPSGPLELRLSRSNRRRPRCPRSCRRPSSSDHHPQMAWRLAVELWPPRWLFRELCPKRSGTLAGHPRPSESIKKRTFLKNTFWTFVSLNIFFSTKVSSFFRQIFKFKNEQINWILLSFVFRMQCYIFLNSL